MPGARREADLAAMSADLMRAIRRITRAVDVQSKRVTRAAGLTIPQIVILQTLRERGPLSTGGLAAEISLSAPTVTTVLERLEGRDLVRRTRKSEDRRIVLTDLTERGREVLAQAPPLMHDGFLAGFARMDGAAQTRLVAALRTLADLMDTGPMHAGLLLDENDPEA
ncbi:MAG: MarR family transcriptional regulator [Sneathiellaceae bacterium]